MTSVAATILYRIRLDEIRHVGLGKKWSEYRCDRDQIVPETTWRDMVSRYFRGSIKPPFNDSARQSAGLTRTYHESLVR